MRNVPPSRAARSRIEMIFGIAPDAPTGLVASNITGPRRLRLDWTNNRLNATRFMIQRANNIRFTSNLRTSYTAGTETNYRDATVGVTTTYFYRVYAQNIVGGGAPGNSSLTVTSLVSNTVSVLTPLAPEAQPLNPNDPAPLPSVDEQARRLKREVPGRQRERTCRIQGEGGIAPPTLSTSSGAGRQSRIRSHAARAVARRRGHWHSQSRW